MFPDAVRSFSRHLRTPLGARQYIAQAAHSPAHASGHAAPRQADFRPGSRLAAVPAAGRRHRGPGPGGPWAGAGAGQAQDWASAQPVPSFRDVELSQAFAPLLPAT